MTMWSLINNCFQSRYHRDNLRSQTAAMNNEARQSLSQKIAETLNTQGDEEDGRENVEGMLGKIEEELEVANKTLALREEKEQFLATRIRKYQEMLKQQGTHLEQLQQRINSNTNTEELEQQKQHYEQQAQKQAGHKEALGKVIDVHMDILKSIKECKRTIAALEQKKYELKNVTKRCREFLVMAEEAEREQQLGVEVDDNDLDAMEMAPLAVENGSEQNAFIEHYEEKKTTSTNDNDDGASNERVDEETGIESSEESNPEKEQSNENGRKSANDKVPNVEPEELVSDKA